MIYIYNVTGVAGGNSGTHKLTVNADNSYDAMKQLIDLYEIYNGSSITNIELLETREGQGNEH